MAKRDLNTEEQEAVDNILKELAGFNVEQAEAILREVNAQLKERAVIE